VYGVVAFAARVLLHRRRTGSSGVSGVSGRLGSTEWLAGVAFVAALAVGALGPLLAVVDIVEPVGALDRHAVHALGIAVFATGFAGTVGAQAAMGASWRIGVDEGERTALVTGGPFRLVRNPIYAAMIPAVGGLALVAPSVVAIAGWVLLVVALELQTRLVEEPHLLRVHGEAYARYAGEVGRFLPGVGRLREKRPGPPG
jgi:protein-S-isoprenylcysteine O-methyltransferase Ste14